MWIGQNHISCHFKIGKKGEAYLVKISNQKGGDPRKLAKITSHAMSLKNGKQVKLGENFES